MLDCLKIIRQFYVSNSEAQNILVAHGALVADKALRVADNVEHLNPDREFIYESAMLHDIGMIYTDAEQICCSGNYPYIAHGILGRSMLENLGLRRHALVCERHIGAGLSREDIVSQKLPIPVRDMLPVSLEEKIVCYADKFFSKSNGQKVEKTSDQVLESLNRHGREKAMLFFSWMQEFEKL